MDREGRSLARLQSPSAKGMSSSEEESELQEAFRPPVSSNKNGSSSAVNRSKVTPSDQGPRHYHPGYPPSSVGGGGGVGTPHQHHLYQDPTEYHLSPQQRLRQAKRFGSSMSSSDNNSDTTYAESDVNNSLRTRMALEHGKFKRGI